MNNFLAYAYYGLREIWRVFTVGKFSQIRPAAGAERRGDPAREQTPDGQTDIHTLPI